jgi:hypothetical protein
MSNDEKRNESIPAHTDDYYEAIASQEELYLEEVEENLRAILIAYKPLASGDANNHRAAESLDEQLNHAAEELITGDSDDPPLSEETVAEMIQEDVHTNLIRLGIHCADGTGTGLRSPVPSPRRRRR